MKANPCVVNSLLFGCIWIAFAAQTFSADACGGNVNTSTNLLGGNMTNAAAPADQKESINRKADSLSKVARGAKLGISFRLFDGALIGVSSSHESFQWPDHEPTGVSDFQSSRNWVGPDATRQTQGLRLFQWSWK